MPGPVSLNPASAGVLGGRLRQPLPAKSEPDSAFSALLNPDARIPSSQGQQVGSWPVALAGPLQERTFGFIDLGMFGLNGPEEDRPGFSDSRIVASGSNESIDGPQIATTGSQLPIDQPGKTAELSGSSAAPSFDSARSIASSGRPAGPAQNAAIGTRWEADDSIISGEDNGLDPDAAGSPAESSALPSERQPPAAINLVLSGEDNTLVIAARAPGEAPEDAATLRRLIDQAAAEFNMRVGEFVFNGVSVRSATRGGSLGNFTG